jgi:hypothetical protein
MPLVGPAMKSKFQSTIHSALQREFGGAVAEGKNYPPIADEFWTKLASAISDIANDIVDEIHNNATVVPGQQVVGTGGGVPGPMTGSTVSPGTIL